MLEKTLEYSREFAKFFPGYDHIADPLIDFADYGMKAATVSALFAELRKELVPIVQAITAQPVADDACLRQKFPEAQQLAFGAEVVKRLGYDFERGRQDKTRHPFCTTFSLGDVRITTRVKENDLGDALFSTIHEAGHAMYEQGIRPSWKARRWRAGRRRACTKASRGCGRTSSDADGDFWEFFYPQLQAAFSCKSMTSRWISFIARSTRSSAH